MADSLPLPRESCAAQVLTGDVLSQEITALNQAFEDREGCRVSGWLDVQRVAGNFHVAVHMEDYVMLDRVRFALCESVRFALCESSQTRQARSKAE